MNAIIVVNLQDSSETLRQLTIYQGQNVRDQVQSFCSTHDIQQHQNQILQVVKQKLKLEEQLFKQPTEDQKLKSKSTNRDELTNRTKINCDRGKILASQMTVYERLSFRSKKNPSISDKDPCCTFKPTINLNSRQIVRKSIQIQQTKVFSDFTTFNKENYENDLSLIQDIPQGNTEIKLPLEKFLLIHCIFIFIDGNDDNLISADEINWILLEQKLQQIIYQVLATLGLKDITFSQFVQELLNQDKFNEMCEHIVNEQLYQKYLMYDLLHAVQTQNFSQYITLTQFIDRYKDQTHVLDQMGPVPKKYKRLILQSLRQ